MSAAEHSPAAGTGPAGIDLVETEPVASMDGAVWFMVILALALVYGLAISALSGADTTAERDLTPRPAAAMVVHGDGLADPGRTDGP